MRDIATVLNGSGFPEHFQGCTGLRYPFVKVSDMNATGADTYITTAANTVDSDMLRRIGARTAPAGTIIFPKVGGALLTNKKRILGVEAAFDNNVMGVQPRRADSLWLYYWFLKFDLRTLANTQALPSIRQSDVAALPISLPPLPVQRRIAAQLKEQLAEVDRARTALQVQVVAADALPAASLRAVFGDPAHGGAGAAQVTLGEILTLRKEVIHPRDRPSGHATFVGLEHVESGTGARLGAVELELSALTGRKPRFYKGDIVYGYLRPYLNKVWLADFDGVCSVDQYVYTIDRTRADAEFVSWFMRSPRYLSLAPVAETPGQLPRIRTQEVAQVPLALPPLAVQHSVAARLRAEFAGATELRQSLAARLATLDQFPAALLRQVFGQTPQAAENLHS